MPAYAQLIFYACFKKILLCYEVKHGSYTSYIPIRAADLRHTS